MLMVKGPKATVLFGSFICSVILVVKVIKSPGPSLAGSRLSKNLIVDLDVRYPSQFS